MWIADLRVAQLLVLPLLIYCNGCNVFLKIVFSAQVFNYELLCPVAKILIEKLCFLQVDIVFHSQMSGYALMLYKGFKVL